MSERKRTESREVEQGLNRRDFLGASAFVGAGAAAAVSGCSFWPETETGPMPAYALTDPDNVLYSTCLQGHVSGPCSWTRRAAMVSGLIADRIT